MNKDKIKNIIYTIGKVVGFISLAYILYKLSQEYTLNSFLDRVYRVKNILIPLIIINIVSLLIGIYGWHIMLLKYAKKSFSYITSYYYYAKTDISKYLPGNVFHLVGRQAFASKIGISQIDMAKISIFHTISLLVATILASTLLAVFVDSVNINKKYIMIFASIVSILIIYFTYPIFSNRKKFTITSIFTLSIALQGFLMAIVVYWQIDNMGIGEFFKIASIYVLSWLIGFVTPGASGGLGVREGAFLAIANFINLSVPTEIVLFSILLVRLINILVDILMFISTLFIKER